ncbi:MAG: FAD:protein FMN transferase [Acidimicrobiales bacterium]|nr:MAG: FAD:protein FMN transferase [Acidimicrobiales bacterium]
MASELHVIVVGDADGNQAIGLLRDLEAHWSRFLHDSDITRLNHASGSPVRVDPSTLTLVATMVDAWCSTDGAFDPSILPTLIESGYRASIDDPYRVTFLPDGRLVVGGYDSGPTTGDIVIDHDGSTITLPPGLVIDPGGIGKGLAADLAVRHLLALGAAGALVSIGGDMAMAGTPPHDDNGWTVTVEHPNLALGNLCTLLVGAGGVATSSTRSRRWIHAGQERHHQIDPRRGEQSSTDLTAVTVIARAGWLAEAHATSALLSGAHGVLEYLDDHELSGIAVALDGTVLATADLSIPALDPKAVA